MFYESRRNFKPFLRRLCKSSRFLLPCHVFRRLLLFFCYYYSAKRTATTTPWAQDFFPGPERGVNVMFMFYGMLACCNRPKIGIGLECAVSGWVSALVHEIELFVSWHAKVSFRTRFMSFLPVSSCAVLFFFFFWISPQRVTNVGGRGGVLLKFVVEIWFTFRTVFPGVEVLAWALKASLIFPLWVVRWLVSWVCPFVFCYFVHWLGLL